MPHRTDEPLTDTPPETAVGPPPAPKSGTVTRIQSGLAALAILIPLLIFGGFWAVFGLALFGVVVSIWEFVRFALPGRPVGTMAVAMTCGLLLCASISLARFDLVSVALALAVFASTLWMLFTARTTDGLADKSCRLLMAILYAGGLVGFLPLLRAHDGGLGWMWLGFGLAWCGDTGGYFAGRAFGRHKMSPLISPKKTWEGFIGGVLLAVVFASLFKLLFFPSMRIVDCIVLGILGDVAGVVGDLVMSVFKRTYGVKDSGRFLPGHGGLLDRIDSVLFTLPTVYIYVAFFVPSTG